MGLKQTFGMKTDKDRDHHTPVELGVFRDLLKRGAISFFRIGRCERCGTQIHVSKRFCSLDCKKGDEGNGDENETEHMD